ncbi:MAG: hypothetical protein NVS2B17_17200 [Candidatus Velthaea sp.]
MDRYKVEHFEQTRGEAFPAYSLLDDAACARIRETIAQKLVLPRNTDRLTIVETLFDQSIALEDMNAQTPGFSLEGVLRNAEITPPQILLVDWYRLDDIDRFGFPDANRYFRDIWYPDADDITLFDDTLKWFVWIDHAGDICVNYL